MIQKITHIILAFLVLLSSSGLVINQHYCGNKLKNAAIFVEAKQCKNEAPTKPPCPLHQKQKEHKPDKKGCCGEEIQFLKLEITQQSQTFNFQAITSFLFVGIITSNLDAESRIPDAHQDFYSIFDPPPLLFDFQIELQTFLC